MGVNGSYLTLLQQLLPPGRAWPREPGARLTKLLSALAEELERVDVRALVLIEESDPRTATETLPDWERALALPDATSPVSYSADRNAAVHGRYGWQGGQDADFYRGLAASAGYDNVSFSGYSMFSCTGPCTQAVRDWHWLSACLITTPAGGNPDLLEWLFAANRQAHAIFVFNYISGE